MASNEVRAGDPIAVGDGRRVIPIALVSQSTTANRATIRVTPWAIDLHDGDRVRRVRIRDATTQAITAVVFAEALTTVLAVRLLRWAGGSRKRIERKGQ